MRRSSLSTRPSFVFVTFAFGALLAGVGCQKKEAAANDPANAPESVALVAATERSAHFNAVTDKLELGGTLFAYADIDGDMLKLAETIDSFSQNAAAINPMAAVFMPKDFAPLFADLGLTDVKALGLSSVATSEDTYRNRVFLYIPEGRHGIFAGLGGDPRPFTIATLAPADVDVAYETEFDFPAVYTALQSVVSRVAGEAGAAMLTGMMERPDPQTGLIPLEVLQQAKGRVSFALRIDPEQTFSPSANITFPVFDFLVRAEGLGATIEQLIPADAPFLTRSTEADGATLYTPNTPSPIESWQPRLLIKEGIATFSTRPEFAGAQSLADSDVLKTALAGVSSEGNGFTYIGAGFTAKINRLLEELPMIDANARQGLNFFLGQLPPEGRAYVSVRQNLPDGILFESRWHTSHKQILMFANPGGSVVTVGLLSAMAIPAFQKVRTTSQEKSVQNNLRQLVAASEQYFLEHGVNTCTYADLIGPKGNGYLRPLKPVAGEDYEALTFHADQPVSVTLANGKTITAER